MTNMTIHEQDRQGCKALTAALETKYKSVCKGIPYTYNQSPVIDGL